MMERWVRSRGAFFSIMFSICQSKKKMKKKKNKMFRFFSLSFLFKLEL